MALEIAASGLDAADPASALVRQVHLEGDDLVLPRRRLNLRHFEHVWIVGAGKATGPLASALEEMLGERLSGGLVVVPEGGTPRTQSRLTWVEAQHPVPGEGSFAAGRQLLDFATSVSDRDIVLSTVTGGSSALATAPRRGISDSEKQLMHRHLLGCGADIRDINTVRKHLSLIKGGRLAAAMCPKVIVNFTVSDVAGDPVEYICDLTVQDRGCSQDAIEVLEKYDLWRVVPPAVRSVLTDDAENCLPDLSDIEIETILLVTGETVCQAMLRRAEALGVGSVILGTAFSAPASAFGTVLANLATEVLTNGRPFRPPVALVACGGESTVAVPETLFGAGGPNQEVALSAAVSLAGYKGVVVMAMDSDGSDGGTEAAGGIVDGSSAGLAARKGIDVRRALVQHDSGRVLDVIGDRVVTGRTGTNVNDLLVVVVDDTEGSLRAIALPGGDRGTN